ncbi:MAG: bis-aminopropyl spermidine synthase family protein [Myxococcota bacterium]
MSPSELRAALADVYRPDATSEPFDIWVEARIDALPAELEGHEPEALLRWVHRMAIATYHAAMATGGGDKSALQVLERVLEGRPAPKDAHGQFPIDLHSLLRRAEIACRSIGPEGRIVAVGDDDCATVALAVLGYRNLAVVDIDPDLLGFLQDAATGLGGQLEVFEVDVLSEPLPSPLRQRADVVLTDPIRSLEPCLQFLLFGKAALRPSGRLLWADHPDWNLEYAETLRALRQAGLELLELHENLHRYPLPTTLFTQLGQHALPGVTGDELERLARLVSGHSHLHVLGQT